MAEIFPQSTQAATVAAKGGLLLERAHHWEEIQTLLQNEPGNPKSSKYLRWLQRVAEHSVRPFVYDVINQSIDP